MDQRQRTIKDLSSTGCHQECLQACQQLLQSEPGNPFPWKYAGKSLLALGQFEKAQQCLKESHKLDATDPETTKDIGNTYLNIGNTENATKWYEKSLRINDHYAPAINNLANIKKKSGDHKEAVNLFKRALQADPQLIQANAGAAASFLTLGDLEQAEYFATEAIKINALVPGINEILGIILQNKGNSQQAVKSYKKELAINPQSNTSLLNLGLLLLQQGNAEEAIEPLTRAAAINPSEKCSLLLAQAYQNIGKLNKAITEYKNIDIIQPQNKMIPFNLGVCLLNTGSNVDAIEAFKIAIKMDESFLPAWGNIGTALINEGRHNEALPVMQKVLELDPDNPIALMNLGSIYKNLGNLDQALATTLKSLELEPDNPTAHMNLGGIYKDLDNLDQALASTLKSLELKPDNPDSHMNLGIIYFQIGKLEKAIVEFEKSLSIKKNPSAMASLSAVYGELGEKEESMKYAMSAVETDENDEISLINLANQCARFDRLEQGIVAAMKAIEINNRSENAYLVAAKILCKQQLFTDAREVLEKAQQNIDTSHMIDGEIVRIKFIEGMLDDQDDSEPWSDDDDFYYEDCNGDNLIISFGSNGRRRADEKDLPLFNFRSTLKFFEDHDKLFIRDLDRNYYMNGIRNSAPSILDLKNLISKQMRAKKYKTVTTIGASSGGFGALLYGNLVEADYMIAFNPQTVLNDERVTTIKDNVFNITLNENTIDANSDDALYRKCLSIKNFIPFKGQAVIHYSNNSLGGIDKRYAEYLKHDNCALIAYESGTHLLALELKETNKLIAAIVASFNPQDN